MKTFTICFILILLTVAAYAAPPIRGRSFFFGTGPSHLFLTQLNAHHYRVCYNADPDDGGVAEDTSSTSDVQCLDLDGTPGTNELCLEDGHAIGSGPGARNKLCVNVVRSNFGPDTAL